MTRTFSAYLEACAALALVVWLTTAQLPLLGLASSALLFLLPVLFAAVRGGLGPGLVAALAGAAAYNFFLLEPRYTFSVHQLDNLVSVFVLVAVALVTSRLASRLMLREADATHRAKLSGELAHLSALLAGQPVTAALARGADYVEELYGPLRLLDSGADAAVADGFSALDASAAAWAVHNGDTTGHGTPTMAVADWTFFPLAPKNRPGERVAAVARPAGGSVRDGAEVNHLQQIVLLLGQAQDREALEAERRERALLEDRDRLRRTFLASMAHDFRTPLTVITGQLAQLVADHPAASDALASAHRLDRMMTDLTGAARMEAGELRPRLESVDLVDVVEAARGGLIVPPGLALDQGIAADLPFVNADPVLLQHMIANLIDNALRHARTCVTVSGAPENDHVVLRISDDGRGIAEHERDRIFERFARAEGGDRTHGSGLGLAIVKGFGDAMGMTVTVAAAPAGGACFSIFMPRGRQDEA